MNELDLLRIIGLNSEAFHGKGVEALEIIEAEEELNLLFADDYREYLLAFGIAAVNSHELTGLTSAERTNVVAVTLKNRAYTDDYKKDFYVIEEGNIDGLVVWQNRSGEIFVNCFGDEPEKIANSLAEYIND